MCRFYSTESSFTRGDDSNPREALLGQTQIYKYVKHLELADCRAKILLIDTQPTLSDGIVIQVSCGHYVFLFTCIAHWIEIPF